MGTGRKRIDMTGERYGSWTCIAPGSKSKWLCRCDCGTEREVDRSNLIYGISTSCGCRFQRGVHRHSFQGCDEDCFNCKHDDCIKPDYLCKSIPEVNAW